jgi:choline dehydrogenase
MGQDPTAVVDAELRVIDASIMPTMTSGHTYVPTNMIGKKGADLALRAAAR